MGRFLHKVEATDEDDEEYVRGLMMKYGQRCFFSVTLRALQIRLPSVLECNSRREVPRHERKKRRERNVEKEASQGTFPTKKLKTVSEYAIASSLDAVPSNT